MSLQIGGSEARVMLQPAQMLHNNGTPATKEDHCVRAACDQRRRPSKHRLGPEVEAQAMTIHTPSAHQ